MKLNQNSVYVTLKMVDGHVVNVVAEQTEAAADVALSVGGILSGMSAKISTIVIHGSELSASEFRNWRLKQDLSIEACAFRYGISPDDIRLYEGKKLSK